MPERYQPDMIENYRYVLVIPGCNWGLAVDSVGGVLDLQPEQVRWRSVHTRREWLAGTVVDKMCALIDVEALNRHFLADEILLEE